MLDGQTILVVEEEFLIALDIQRMLEAHGAGHMLFARTAEEAHELTLHWPEIGLAIVEIRLGGRHSTELVAALLEAGIAVILNTADIAIRGGHPAFSDVPVMLKPMAEEDLVSAIGQVMPERPRMSGCGS